MVVIIGSRVSTALRTMMNLSQTLIISLHSYISFIYIYWPLTDYHSPLTRFVLPSYRSNCRMSPVKRPAHVLFMCDPKSRSYFNPQGPQWICRCPQEVRDRRLTVPSRSARSLQQSSLLRPHAEIRKISWEFAYSNRLVNVGAPYHRHSLIDKVYVNKPANKSMGRSSPNAHAPSLVCKQIRATASTVFLYSAGFDFVDLRDFHAFIESGQLVIKRVRQVQLKLDSSRTRRSEFLDKSVRWLGRDLIDTSKVSRCIYAAGHATKTFAVHWTSCTILSGSHTYCETSFEPFNDTHCKPI
jgi:hypothetical protein